MWVSKKCYEELQKRAYEKSFTDMLMNAYQDLATHDRKQHTYLLEKLVETQKQLYDLQLEHNELLKQINGDSNEH